MTEATAAVRLAPLTTLRLGGPARGLVRATTEAELVEAVRGLDAAGAPLFVLAGGSNVVVAQSKTSSVQLNSVQSLSRV